LYAGGSAVHWRVIPQGVKDWVHMKTEMMQLLL